MPQKMPTKVYTKMYTKEFLKNYNIINLRLSGAISISAIKHI